MHLLKLLFFDFLSIYLRTIFSNILDFYAIETMKDLRIV